jgi:hypothetical protein
VGNDSHGSLVAHLEQRLGELVDIPVGVDVAGRLDRLEKGAAPERVAPFCLVVPILLTFWGSTTDCPSFTDRTKRHHPDFELGPAVTTDRPGR